MPKRKAARAHSSDEDFVVTTEDELSEDDYRSPSEDISEERDPAPPKRASPPPPRSTRRQSKRTPAPATRQRKEAQVSALEKLKSARKALETRKKATPTPTTKKTDLSFDNASDDSWSEKEEEKERSASPSPSPARKQVRGRKKLPATTIAARLGNKRGSAQKKPSALLLGHRDYTERDGGGGRGGSYSDEDDIADFIASSSGEEEEESDPNSEEESSEDDALSSEDEEKQQPKVAKTKKKAAAALNKTTKKAKEKTPLKKRVKVEKKVNKRQHASSEEEEEEEEEEQQEEEENQEDEEFERVVASQERRRLKLRGKAEVLIVSSSSESEEDIDAVLAATTTARATVGASLPPPKDDSAAANEGFDVKRKRLRKMAEKVYEQVPLRSLQPEKERNQKETGEAHEEQLAGWVKKQKLRQQDHPPRLSAAERIAQAQAAFKSRTREPTKEESSDNEEKGAESTDNDVGIVNLSDDSAGSLRDMITDDDEEEVEKVEEEEEEDEEDEDLINGASRSKIKKNKKKKKKNGSTGRASSPTWSDKLEALEEWRAGQQRYRDDEACFYDYVEYLLMCYVDPTYRGRINESLEHKTHFQHSVRRIETKMTTARDAVHSEAWRSCSRGLLEAVEWLPGAQSNWDPDSVRENNNTSTENYGNLYDDDSYWEESSHSKCAACNRKNSHATRTIIFKGKPRPPPEDETWEDVPANKKLSEKYLAASPVYKKKRSPVKPRLSNLSLQGVGAGGAVGSGGVAVVGRQGGGRRGFQLGFRDNESENEYDSDDSLSRFIQRSRRGSQQQQDSEEEEEERNEENKEEDAPEADLPFDPEKGLSGKEYIRREFQVGRQCSARLMLYHGMFHWKHRLLSRLKFELKEERRRRKRASLPIDPGSVSDGVLSREPLKKALWNNFKELTALGEAHQLAGGEIGNSAWRGGPAVDPHRQVVAVLAALHDDNDGEESDVYWGVPGEEEEEQEQGGEGQGGDEDSDEGKKNIGDKKRRKIAQMYKKKRQNPPHTDSVDRRNGQVGTAGASASGWRTAGGRDDGKAQQVDIRNFFGSPVKKEEEEEQETGRMDKLSDLPDLKWKKRQK